MVQEHNRLRQHPYGTEKKIREFYIKQSEQRNLDRRILERRQAPNEAVRPFVTDLCTLMCRHGSYNLEKKLERMANPCCLLIIIYDTY